MAVDRGCVCGWLVGWLVTSGAVIYLGAPRPNFLCRSTREELERECIPLRTTHVTGYGRCEQIFTLFFAYQ